jgi:hypothetical protein
VSITLANIIDIVTLLGALAALLVIFQTQRKTTMKTAEREGLHLATITELRRDLTACIERVASVERDARTTEGSVIELKTDVRHILDSLTRIEEKLDRRTRESNG